MIQQGSTIRRKLLRLALICCCISPWLLSAFAQQDPSSMNGGSMLAMAGKNCVALAVDRRFGSGYALINTTPRPLLIPSSNMLVGFTGLAGDVQSVQQELSAQVASKYHRGLGFLSLSRRSKQFSPHVLASITSHVLYNQRTSPYYVEPIIVGLGTVENDDNGNDSTSDDKSRCVPFLCSMDMIGAQSVSKAFMCVGTASQSLYGIAEAVWKPDLDHDELVETCGRAFISALERDCLSGYGVIVYLITSKGITEYELAGRND